MSNDTEPCTFEELVNDVDPELRSICNALRDVISTLHPDYVEIIWENQKIASYGIGPKKMSEHYTYIGLQKKHVNLGFYHGTSLTNSNGLLEGTGKLLRHVKVRGVADAKRVEIKNLVAEAITEIKESLE